MSLVLLPKRRGTSFYLHPEDFSSVVFTFPALNVQWLRYVQQVISLCPVLEFSMLFLETTMQFTYLALFIM